MAAACPALADTVTSDNWAGYVMHARGIEYVQASGSWIEPAVTCAPQETSSVAFWVGLGGWVASSHRIEQLGTEADCDRGSPAVSAWYQLMPGPTRQLALRIGPGDLIGASVSVRGRAVTLRLADLTRGDWFTRTLRPAAVDTSSAEWVTEVPNACDTGDCGLMPLADFGEVRFTAASAAAARGQHGPLGGAWIGATRVVLWPAGVPLAAPTAMMSGGLPGTAPAAVAAGAPVTPTPVLDAAGAFDLRYRVAPGAAP